MIVDVNIINSYLNHSMLQNPLLKVQSPNLVRGLSEIDRQDLEKIDHDSMIFDSVD